MAYGYQDDSFDVDEVRGQRLAGLLVFMDDDAPQKLLGVLENGQRFHFYLWAFIGFWSELDEEGYEDVLSDYEDCIALDYAAKHDLTGLEIKEATCRKTSKGTCISVRFRSGLLRLTEVDPTDPHSDSSIEFVRKTA